MFDINNAVHLDYVVAAANLKAKIYNIPQSRDREVILFLMIVETFNRPSRLGMRDVGHL